MRRAKAAIEHGQSCDLSRTANTPGNGLDTSQDSVDRYPGAG
jgi:hypothetical protein